MQTKNVTKFVDLGKPSLYGGVSFGCEDLGMKPFHYTLKAPTKEHVKAAIRLARWARGHGDMAAHVRFLNDAKDMRKWISDARNHNQAA